MLMIKHQQPLVASQAGITAGWRDGCGERSSWLVDKAVCQGVGIGLGLAGLSVVYVVPIHLSARPLLQAAATPVSFVLERLSHGEFKNWHWHYSVILQILHVKFRWVTDSVCKRGHIDIMSTSQELLVFFACVVSHEKNNSEFYIQPLDC